MKSRNGIQICLGALIAYLVPMDKVQGATFPTLREAPPPELKEDETQLESEIEKFKVVEITGILYALEPWDFRWRPVALNDVLNTLTLVQSRDEFALALEPVFNVLKKEGGDKEKDLLKIKSKVGMMLRIQDHLARNIHMKTITINTSGRGLPPPIVSARNKMAAKEIKSAWERASSVSATVPDTSKANPDTFKPKNNGADMSMTTNRGTLTLTFPGGATTVLTGEYPLDLPVKWEIADFAQPPEFYSVYVWPDKSEAKDPLLVTKEKAEFLQFFSPGIYMIQVRTLDGRVSSETIQLEVVAP